jgi:hypothetical protein
MHTEIDLGRHLPLMNTKILVFILRVGVSATFLAHGLLALNVNPSWVPLLTAVGFSKDTAENLLPLIGSMDVFTAFLILFRPFRGIVLWSALWAFAAALSRPIAGLPILEFIERASNWILPLALLWLMRFPKKWKDLLH